CSVTEWTGGLYISPTMAGSRPGGLVAGAWAAMMSLGLNGYLESTGKIMEVSKKIQKGIDDISGLFVIGKPDMTVVAFGSDAVDIFEVNDIMSSNGWHLNALQRPNSLHICVTLQHTAIYEEFLKDLEDSVNTVSESESRAYQWGDGSHLWRCWEDAGQRHGQGVACGVHGQLLLTIDWLSLCNMYTYKPQ
uniref:Sphingosine-1-phosphate lyase n=1 Tax=Aegilops tauschii subsp. strangulata TaxID=200361 RepID=A0A453E139_AEGTS